MKNPEMAMPFGLSTTLAISAWSRTAVSKAKPTVATRRRWRATWTVTAEAPETIMARIPVAYAPAWAATSAPKAIAMTMHRAVETRTTGRTARPHSGTMP
ncbi:hypothetical protein [[Kitasatospora] papulosa]|uniref:hypothetical protein n=1 Tax=[Kitasatospora] papulosa TaxID=1464011 RepID=UPI0036A539BE